MINQDQIIVQNLKNIEEASYHVFQILSKQIGINTFFIAKNDGHRVDVLKTLNKEYTLLEDGFTIEYQKSF